MPLYPDDKRLVKQLLAGDEVAFNRFFDGHFARLYRFASARLGDDPEAASDIVQITLTKALRKLGTYRAESALFTWLCAICRNEISDWLRREGRHAAHVVLTEDFGEVRAAIDSLPAPACDDPEREYRRLELHRLVQVALDRLPAHYGNVLEWKYVEGRSVREIAARLELGTEATQSLLARAKRAFAEVYSTMAGAISTHKDELMQP